MFADWRDRSIEDALTEHGPAAHGLAWENVVKVGCWAAADSFDFEANESTWLDCSADVEAEFICKMEQYRWIQYVQPDNHLLERRIVLDLNVSAEHAREVLSAEGEEA